MTISSSLNAGVAGLNVNASRLATISDNIANSGTYGYKRAVTDFQSMVIGQGHGSYSAGGVRVMTDRLIDQRGTLISTNNPTDLAIGGRGMMPVTTENSLNDTSGSGSVMLTTTGSFRANSEGYLTTQTGLVLMGWPANSDGSIPTFPRDSTEGLEPIRAVTGQLAGDPTTRIGLTVNLPATHTAAGTSFDPSVMSTEYFDSLGTSQTLEMTYTPTVPGVGSSNEWTMTIRDSASGGAVVAEYSITFDDAPGNGGNLDSVTAISGAAYNPTDGTIAIATASGSIELAIGTLGDPSGLTQLSDTFAISPAVKDGAPVGAYTSMEVDSEGMVHAIYDNGMTRVIYQVPVIDVPNPNGLIAMNSQAYQISPDSGAFFMWDAGDGPTGDMIGFAREESTTDVAGELTQLIQTQRAYSSNAKIIQTVDEMLQETTNIKR